MFWTNYMWVNGYSSIYFNICDPIKDPNCYVGKYVGETQYNVYGTYRVALLPPAKTEVTAEASALYDCHAVKLVDDMDVQCKKCDIIGPLHVHGPQETTQSFSVFASPDSHENATEAY